MHTNTPTRTSSLPGSGQSQVDGNALIALVFGAAMLIDLAVSGPGHALDQGAPERLIVAARAIGAGGLALGGMPDP